MIWENGIETCILSYVKPISSPGLMHDTGCSGLVHWDDPEGRYWEGEGRGFRMGNTSTPVADSCQCMAKPIQYCKVISLQLKKKQKNKKNRSSSHAGDERAMDLIPGLGRSPGGGNRRHSSILAGIISWTEEPGKLQSMGSQRVRHS